MQSISFQEFSGENKFMKTKSIFSPFPFIPSYYYFWSQLLIYYLHVSYCYCY